MTGTIEIKVEKEGIPNKIDVIGEYEIYAVAPNKRVEINRLEGGACIKEEALEGFNGTVGWSKWGKFHKLDGAGLAEKRLEAEFYREINIQE